MNKYIVGIDLGINNVGWSIINKDTREIEKCGVRLFNSSDAAADRRGFRSSRRLKKRKETRIKDVLKVFEIIGFPNKNTVDSELLEKRVNGLTSKLNMQDIVNICCYFASHRGYIPFGDEERELVKLNGQLPCIYYKELLETKGKYRALEQVVDNKDIMKEFDLILENQIIYYPKLNDIKNDIRNIITRKRKFWEGPGSVTSFTEYGRFKNEQDVLEYEKLKASGGERYLYDELIGKCSIYPYEKTVPLANYYYEKFNMLNDFINTSIKTTDSILQNRNDCFEQDKQTGYYKLNTKGLEVALKYCEDNPSLSSYIKIYKECFGLKKEDLTGYRIKKDGSPEFSTLNTYRTFLKAFSEYDISWIKNYDMYNELIRIIALSPGIVETKKMIEGSRIITYKFNDEEYGVLKDVINKIKKQSSPLKYGKFSERALKRASSDMLSMAENYQRVSRKNDYAKEAREEFIKRYKAIGTKVKLMDNQFVDDIVASPQVKKSLRQAIKVINAIIKEKGEYPDIIAIESTKEMNGKDLRNEINKEQKDNENRRTRAVETLKKYFDDSKITEVNILKTMLYEEVDGRCPYCNKPFDGGLNSVIHGNLEVEHILPLSRSFNDSYNNKTLACRACNGNGDGKGKNNKTPYEWFGSEQFIEFAERITKLSISDAKKLNFLETRDLDKYNTRFFNRNLRDTAYGTKELINQINIYNNYLNELDKNFKRIKTLSTPGQLTHKIRVSLELPKDRDDGKYHHAVDASIVAGIALDDKLGNLLIESQNEKEFWIKSKNKIYQTGNYIKSFDMQYLKESLKKIKSDADIKISMQVCKDSNVSIANSNIYKFIKLDDGFKKVSQISNIYDEKLLTDKAVEKLFNDNDKVLTLMIQDNNPKMYEKLKEIFNTYKDKGISKNPFVNYCMEINSLSRKEEFDYRIHGIKQNKGPIVKRLRYYQAVSEPSLLNKTNINKKKNTYIGLDKIAQVCTQVYWDNDKKKFIFMPIYVTTYNQQKNCINKNSDTYKTFFTKYLEGKNYTHVVDLYNGDLIEVTKNNGEVLKGCVSGFDKHSNRMDLKNDKKLKFTTSDLKLSVYDADYLGNERIRLTWPKK